VLANADIHASLQRMNALRAEADESAAKVEELSAKVRTLEQENLQKEQEITSLQHKNGVLEQEVEKLEGLHKGCRRRERTARHSERVAAEEAPASRGGGRGERQEPEGDQREVSSCRR
jgi:chromosome segregation ATPase